MRAVILSLVDFGMAGALAVLMNVIQGQPWPPNNSQVLTCLIILLLVRSNEKKGGEA